MQKYKKTSLYICLLNIYRFRHCFKNIGQEFGFFSMFKLCFLNLINKKEDIVYVSKLKMFVKPNFFVITTLIEIFNHKLYWNLQDLDCVLDLWWFIGESALYLARNNKKVIVFEPSKEKFKLLEKNISSHENIIGFNYAVVASKDVKELVFFERNTFDFCSSSDQQKKLDKKVKVDCKDIFSILEDYDFDGLKMDIEWWEYPIIQGLLDKNKFNFKKWVIEFHFTGENRRDKVDIYNRLYKYLMISDFTIRLYDNYNHNILPDDHKNIWMKSNLLCLNLEFYKK